MDINKQFLTERLVDVESLKKLIANPDFKHLEKVFDLLKEKSMISIINSYEKDEKDMRAAIAYRKALDDILSFIVNVDRDIIKLKDTIHKMNEIEEKEKNMRNLNINRSSVIIKK
jgi:hypothetical protein